MGVNTGKKQVEVVEKIDTTNPFNKGVSYEAFLENVKGNVTVDSLLKKAKCTDSQIEWIKTELQTYKTNKK